MNRRSLSALALLLAIAYCMLPDVPPRAPKGWYCTEVQIPRTMQVEGMTLGLIPTAGALYPTSGGDGVPVPGATVQAGRYFLCVGRY